MPIFVQGSGEERDIAELFLKFKNNKKALTHIFDRGDYQLIDKCLKELKSHLSKQEKMKDSIKLSFTCVHILKKGQWVSLLIKKLIMIYIQTF